MVEGEIRRLITLLERLRRLGRPFWSYARSASIFWE